LAGIGEIEIWGLLLLVGSSFVATNLDNLVLLVVMLGANLDPGLIGYTSSDRPGIDCNSCWV
jgi:hypothetical protein